MPLKHTFASAKADGADAALIRPSDWNAEHAVVTGAAPATPVANQLYTDSIVKGWLKTSGAGAWTIDDDLNVSSITDNGVGDLTINWATAFASASYAVVGMSIEAAPGSAAVVKEDTTTAKTASLVRLHVFNSTANSVLDPSGIQVIAIGDQ